MLSRKERKKLYKASRKGREAKVNQLLDRVTDSRVLEKALYKASKHGRENVVSLLLDRVADCDTFDKALSMATDKNHENVVGLLLNKSSYSGVGFALYKASTLGYTSVVRILLDKAFPRQARLPVQIASSKGYVSIVCLLRDHMLKERDVLVDTLLGAAMRGDETVVGHFLDKFAEREVPRHLVSCLTNENVLPLILKKLPISEVVSMLQRTNGHPDSIYRCISVYLKELKDPAPKLILSTEGQEIKVHKEVVSYWSKYFQAAFQFEDKQKYEFDPDIVSFRALQAIVDFCYSGMYSDLGCPDLKLAAEYLGIECIDWS